MKLQTLLLEGEKLTASGTYALRVDGNEMAWSPGFYNLTGFDPTQAIAVEALFACVHPQDVAALRAEWEASYADGKERQMRYRFKPMNREMRWFESHWRMALDHHGRPEVCYGSIRDVTDKVLLTDSLKAGERLARSGSIRFDFVEKTAFWTQGVYTLFGFDPAQGPDFSKILGLMGAEDRDQLNHLWATSWQTPGTYQHEHLAQTPQGQTWIRTRWDSVPGVDGKPAYAIGHLQDISKERELAALAQAAQAANASKNRFLATISHELRTPLTAVVGVSQLLMEDKLSEEKKRPLLAMLHEGGQAMHHIINDLLDLAQIEAGRLNIERSTCDLMDLLTKLATSYTALCEGKDLTFELLTGPQVPAKIHVDAQRLRQILLNLLSNALKFTQAGGITLKVVVAQTQLVFGIEDTGIGIAPAQLSRLFEPFAQADEQIARAFGGTGLGLSICRELAKLMGGEVGVSSTLGTGSKFWLALPLAAVALPAEQSTPPEAALPDLRGVRVLVVDDNQVNAVLAVRMLEFAGAHTESVLSGQAALDRVAQTGAAPLDLVLMDIHMPGMDGLEATRRLRASGAQLPIVAMTADVLWRKKDAALNAGMNDVVSKPFEMQELLQAVAHHTGR